jgi:hypothetical protein
MTCSIVNRYFRHSPGSRVSARAVKRFAAQRLQPCDCSQSDAGGPGPGAKRIVHAHSTWVADFLCYNNPNQVPAGSLCAVAPPAPLAPTGQVNLAWLRALDLRLSWVRAVSEKVTIHTSAGFYNLFNFANFDLPGNALNGVLTGAPGQINGTTRSGHHVNRVGVGTGVQLHPGIEFGLRVVF